jgi:hypothetical protein
MQYIMANVDLNSELKHHTHYLVKTCKEHAKDATTKEIEKICSDNFTNKQISDMLNVFFDIHDVMKSKYHVFRGKTRYFLLAGVMYYICNNMDLTLKLFLNYGIYGLNARIIYLYSTLINKSIEHKYDYYDDASNELTMNTS